MAEGLDQAISLVGSRVALVAGPGLDGAFLDRVRQIVHSKDPFRLLVSAMTDTGLRSVPSLACAVTERGGVRVLVRGTAKVLVKTSGGTSETVSAKGVSTWHEQPFTEVEELVLVTANGPGATTSLVLFLDAAAQRLALQRVADRRRAPAEAATAAPPLSPVVDPAGHSDGTLAALQEPPAPPVPVRPPPPAPPVVAPPDEDGLDLDFGHLVEDTRYRGVEAAAIRPQPEDDPSMEIPVIRPAELDPPTVPVPSGGWPSNEPVPSFGSSNDADDDDGNTISLAELRMAVADSEPTNAVPTVIGQRPATGPSVHASFCPSGHSNPPQAERCRVCEQPIDDLAISVVSRPVLGRLRFDDGLVVDLDRPVLLGRKPTYRPGQAESVDPPRLITLADPDQSLSRLHAEVLIDGWQVSVVDRDSTNGTTVTVPGGRPVDLQPNEPMPVVPGTRIELGDSAACTFEEAVVAALR